MPHINLLSWREASRKEAQKQFLSILFLVTLISFGSVFAISMVYSAMKDGQIKRNQFLTSEISVLDKRIAQIKELDKKKENLHQRMRLIEELQSNRNLGTQIMDEIATVVSSGVYLTKLERRDNAIQIIGKSESNNRLSRMLRQLESSYLFQGATLQDIIAGEQQARLLSDFNMQFTVKPYEKIGEVKQ